MKILYIGDIVAKIGRQTVKKVLPELIAEHKFDFVIAQGENMSTGNGMRIEGIQEMQAVGVDFFTGGNHSWHKREFYPYLDDPKIPVIRPANYPLEAPGRGWAIADTPHGKVLVINLLGMVGGIQPAVNNPFETVDKILLETKNEKVIARIVDFHADYTSEKIAIGYYLDGKVSAVVGSHTHVPTADARVLPGGTAVITDVGMVGPRDGILGVAKEPVINRFRTGMPAKHTPAEGPCQFDAVSIEIDTRTGKSTGIQQILRTVEV